MEARLDHVVIWVADPLRSLEFFARVVGLAPVRAEEFRKGEAPFPSVRVSGESVIDLMPQAAAQFLNGMSAKVSPLVAESAGHRVHHVCLALPRPEWDALRGRLETAGQTPLTMGRSFGARGVAPETFYFHDPDGNVFEARYYD